MEGDGEETKEIRMMRGYSKGNIGQRETNKE